MQLPRDTAAAVHRSFVRSPRLRQGHRRLRMTVAEKGNSRTKGKADFKRLRRLRDADIDDSDIPKLDKSFHKHAKLTMPQPKDRRTIRVDHDVVEWLKKSGSGYQTRINAILRSYMKAQSE
jgi:uncharacterized protein (DUF4415 family)